MKELSTETRVLLAFILSMAIMAIWGTFFMPKRPPKPPETQAPVTAPASTQPDAPAKTPAAPPDETSVAISAVAPAAEPKAASAETSVFIENELYRVELSNRGGVVRSWQLKDYVDDAKPPRTLDVVHADAAAQLGGWPLSLALDDPQLEEQVNSALYTATPSSGTHAPGEVRFAWSDGHLEVTKRLTFDHNYLVDIETEVRLDGTPLPHGIAWRGGFGDPTAYSAADHVTIFYRANGKLQSKPHKDLGNSEQPEQRLREPATLDYAGIQDLYFAAAFVPRGPGLALWHWRLEREVMSEGTTKKEPVAEMAAGSTTAGPVAVRLFVGPKDLAVLSRLNPPMTELVDFGEWLGVLAKPLFYFLKWIHNYVPNYGWAIVLMTIAINMVLFPLKVKSWRSMQKMQKVGPEIKSIQEKYKKYSMRDPRKQKMNEEVMAVYKREGINPMGSCWPMLLQMPIWFALYRMLNAAIELRHAPWLWIHDLSAKDPFYILPVTMAVTMYLMQKMTPATTMDPQQQRMMQLMPIMFGGMFVVFPISSGLVLYILASNVVGIAQQWYLNRHSPAPATGKAARKQKGK